MGWRQGEVWFDIDVLWFNEKPRPAFALAGRAPAAAGRPIPNGLVCIAATAGGEAAQAAFSPRRRGRARGRLDGHDPSRRSSLGSAASAAQPLVEDPPSLTSASPRGAPGRGGSRRRRRAEAARARALRRRDRLALRDLARPPLRREPFRRHTAAAGGTDWVTWDPVTDSVPNEPVRLFGNENTIRTIVSVSPPTARPTPTHRASSSAISASGAAARWTSTSRTRRARRRRLLPPPRPRLRAPVATSQIDRARAQDLLNRFVAAGAQMVFVGFSTGLHGPGGVVIPYPNHENHMHVRFPPPR